MFFKHFLNVFIAYILLRSRQREGCSKNLRTSEVIAQIRGSCRSHLRFTSSWKKPNWAEPCSQIHLEWRNHER